MIQCSLIRRYIPACAGETELIAIVAFEAPNRVHPRVCGGNIHLARRVQVDPKVHPRVCGGNTAHDEPPAIRRTGVHPRVCGGNKKPAHRHDHEFLPGTSPRVRGKPRPRRWIWSLAGSRVHPRVCGGNLELVELSDMCTGGTSPRVRGKRQDLAVVTVPCVKGTSPRVRGKLLYMVYELGDVSRSSVRQIPPDDV